MIDWPIGTPVERAAAIGKLPGSWVNSNPFDNYYEIAPGVWNYHDGVDLNLNSPTWNSDYLTPIYSIADGMVTFTGVGGGSWGHIIDIKHIDTDGQFFVSRFGHVAFPIVKTGDVVKMGQQVAQVGDADGYYHISGAHLHWNISSPGRDIMLKTPNQWCGTNKALLLANYTDPIAFVIARKTVRPTIAPAIRWVNATDGLRVRSGPATTFPILSLLPYGTQITVDLSQKTGVFLPLIGKPGWVSADYLQATVPPPIVVAPPVIVPVAPPKRKSGYGPHVLKGFWYDSLASYPIVKCLDDVGALTRAHKLNGNAVHIYRHYDAALENLPQYIAQSGGVQPAAQRLFNDNAVAIASLSWALFEGSNEQDLNPDMVAFETAYAKLVIAAGRLPCVLNAGVGHTDDKLWKRLDVQHLVKLVQDVGGAVGLHCYGEGTIAASAGDHYWKADGSWSTPGSPWPTSLPTQSGMLWQAMRIVDDQRALAGLGLVPWLIGTEGGTDDNYNGGSNGVYRPHNVQTRGWRSCENIWSAENWCAAADANAFYKKSLQWWCDITGFLLAVYAHGDNGTFDTRGLL